MAAVLTDGALDLSAKPYDIKPLSPRPRYSPGDSGRADRPPSAVSSDADDSGIMSPRKRPALGCVYGGGGYSPRRFPGRSPRASPELSPGGSGGSVGSTPRSSPGTTTSPPGRIDSSPAATALTSPISSINHNNNNNSNTTNNNNNNNNHHHHHHLLSSPGFSPTSPRPFKMYPFEPLPNMYSQLAAAASHGVYGYGPAVPSPTMGGPNLFDGAISFSSPIGQYLQQKKRRLESRDCGKAPPPPPMGLHSPGADVIGQLPPLPPPPPPASGGSTSGGEDSGDGSLSGMHNGGAAGLGGGGCGIGGLGGIIGGVDMKKIQAVPEDRKDDAYWERRRKNNEAAKRSRDARRAKEEEIALRAAFLEQENLKLRAQVAILKNETAKLHYMLYNRM